MQQPPLVKAEGKHSFLDAIVKCDSNYKENGSQFMHKAFGCFTVICTCDIQFVLSEIIILAIRITQTLPILSIEGRERQSRLVKGA